MILEYEPDFRSTLFGEVDGHGVGGESGDVDAGEGAFTDSAPCELSVREDGNLDEGRAPEISGGGFELEAGDGGRAGLDDDFSGLNFGVLRDDNVGGRPVLKDEFVLGKDGFFAPERNTVDAEWGLEEVEGSALILSVSLHEADEGLGSFFGSIANFEDEVAALVGRQRDFGAPDIHVAGVIINLGVVDESLPALAVGAALNANGADEIAQGCADIDASGRECVRRELEMGFDAIVGEFLERGGASSNGMASTALFGGVEGLDEAREFLIGAVKETQVGQLGAGGRKNRGIEAHLNQARGGEWHPLDGAGGGEVGRHGGKN